MVDSQGLLTPRPIGSRLMGSPSIASRPMNPRSNAPRLVASSQVSRRTIIIPRVKAEANLEISMQQRTIPPAPYVAYISHAKRSPGKSEQVGVSVHEPESNLRNKPHPSSDHDHLSNPNSRFENTRPGHNIMKLFKSHTRTQPSTSICLQNHILQ